MSLEWTKSFINNAQANGSSIPDTTVSAVEEDKNIFEEVQTLNNQTNNKNDVSDDNKKDKDVFEAVSVKLLSSIFEKNYSMLNSPDSYGWTGELRNSIVEIFGYDVSFEDINAILDVQKRGIEDLAMMSK